MHCKTVTILLRIRVTGHFVMSITKNHMHESHYVTVLDNPLPDSYLRTMLKPCLYVLNTSPLGDVVQGPAVWSIVVLPPNR